MFKEGETFSTTLALFFIQRKVIAFQNFNELATQPDFLQFTQNTFSSFRSWLSGSYMECGRQSIWRIGIGGCSLLLSGPMPESVNIELDGV